MGCMNEEERNEAYGHADRFMQSSEGRAVFQVKTLAVKRPFELQQHGLSSALGDTAVVRRPYVRRSTTCMRMLMRSQLQCVQLGGGRFRAYDHSQWSPALVRGYTMVPVAA